MTVPIRSGSQSLVSAAQKQTSQEDDERIESAVTERRDPAQPRRIIKILRRKRQRPKTEDTSSGDESTTESSDTSRYIRQTQNSRHKRKRYQPQECCPVCDQMLRECFSQSTQQPVSKSPNSANFPNHSTPRLPRQTDVDGFLVPSIPASALRLRIAKLATLYKAWFRDINVEGLEVSAYKCAICSLLLSVLHGANGLAITQTKAYNNPDFNRSSLYDENGCANIEALIDPGKKVSIVLRAGLTLAEKSPDISTQALTGLSLEFFIDLRTQTYHGKTKYNLAEILPIFRLSDAADGASGLSIRLSKDPRPSKPQKIDMIRTWILEDVFDVPIVPHQVYPTRLLDVSVQGQVILVDCTTKFGSSKNDSQFPRYTALSHRWGASRHLIATKGEMAQLLDGVSIDQLPQTFRDAVSVTLEIGVEYLWIDALCIIQDSAEDWLQESERMGDIFKNAFVTIAVHCARDDSEGFLESALSKRNPVEYSLDTQRIGLYRGPNPDVDITGSGLSKRGWVLQERFLSTRTLHFTIGQLYFEIRRGIRCEDGSLMQTQNGYKNSWKGTYEERQCIPRSSLLNPSSLPELRGLLGLEHIPPTPKQPSFLEAEHTTLEWLELVEMYSHCDLTHESDKLIAVSGMSRKIHTKTKQSYCAGIWADKLCQGLLWLASGSSLFGPFPRAPSWSWAAWDGAIQFPLDLRTRHFVPRCKFVSLQNHSEEPTSFLNGPGGLVIRGKLVDVSFLRAKGYASFYDLGPGPPRMGIITQGTKDLPLISLKSYVGVRALWSPKESLQPVGWIAPDISRYLTSNVIPLGSTYFLVIGTSKKELPSIRRLTHRVYQEQGTFFFGIFLIRQYNGPKPVYHRRGFGQLSNSFLSSQTGNPESTPGLSEHRWLREEDIFEERELTDVLIV